jgi:hypothetical protein
VSILDAGTLGSIAEIIRGTGFALTFTYNAPGVHDPATETFGAPSTLTMTGYALDVTQEPETYESGELVAKGSVKVLWWPDTEGQIPPKGATCTVGAALLTVDGVLPVRPGGVAFASKVTLV